MQVHRSNRIEVLADIVGRLWSSAPGGDAFAEDVLVVQSEGMAQWLRVRLSRTLGVVARIEVQRPRQLIDHLLQATTGRSQGAAWRPDRLVWGVLDALDEVADATEPGGPGVWLAGADTARRFQLAQRLADLFDQYAVYRPELVLAWEQGEEDHWQARLWRALVARLGADHPASLARDALAALDHGGVKHLPARVVVFGISALPPLYLRLLAAMGEVVEVHLAVLAPAEGYWSAERRQWARRGDAAASDDAQDGAGPRALLGSLGRVGADLDDLLVELDAIGGDDDALFVPPSADTLLGALQRGLLRPDEPVQAPPTCDTVRVLGCHGPMREVEAAADVVRGLLEAHPELSPRDVVVLTPSLDVHGPLLEAVWGVSPDHPRYLPWSVADRRQLHRNAPARALLDVLALVGGRLGAAEVVALLQHAPLRAAYEIEEDDVGLLVPLVEAAGVRWGADAAHRATFGWPDDATSWRAGLDRMLLGVALEEGDLVAAGGAARAPLGGIRGDAAIRAGRLAALVDDVLDVVQDAASPRVVSAWQASLAARVDAWFSGDGDRAAEVRSLREAIAELAAAAAEGGFTGEVPVEVVRGLLDRAFRETRHPGGFLRGGITVCELLPMRAVPFEVVVLLGISDGVFPRSDARLGFDLMAGSPRPGDRSRRDDDRWMFLEALLSARRALVVTAVCRDALRDRALPPSPVVHELVEAVTAMGGSLSVEEVPLQPFSRAYVAPGGPVTWDRASWDAALRTTRALVPPHALTDPLPLWSLPASVPGRLLADVLRDPVAAYLRYRLGVRHERHEGLLPEVDPVWQDDALEGWAVGDAWLSARLRCGDPTSAAEAMVAAGTLPGGALAAAWASSGALVEAIARAAEAAQGDAAPWLRSVQVDVAGTSVHERVQGAGAPGVRVVPGVSGVDPARVAPQLPMHLAGSAGGAPVRTEVLGKGARGSVGQATLWPLPPDEARAMLGELVELAVWCLEAPRQVLPRAVVGGAQQEDGRLLDAMVKQFVSYGPSEAWSAIFGERPPDAEDDARHFAAVVDGLLERTQQGVP